MFPVTTIIWTQESKNAGISVFRQVWIQWLKWLPFLSHCFLYVGSILQQFLPNRSVLSNPRWALCLLIFPDMNLLACMLCPMLNQPLDPRECKADWSATKTARLGKIIPIQVWTWTEGWEGNYFPEENRISIAKEKDGMKLDKENSTDGYLSEVYRLCLGKHLINH